MSDIFYADAAAATDSTTGEPDYSTGYQCEVCGTELQYGGRGRKPRKCTPNNGGDPSCFGSRTPSTSGPSYAKSSSKKVEAALAVMEGLYDQLTQVLMIVSPNGAAELEKRIPRQQQRNRLAFEANPKLTDRIVSMGQKGGSLTFILSNVAMLAMVGRIAYADVMAFRSAMDTLSNLGGSANGANGPADLSSMFAMFNPGGEQQ